MTKAREASGTSEANRLTSIGPVGQFCIHVGIGLFALSCIIPFLFVVIVSFTPDAVIREHGYSFFPKELGLEAYQSVFIMGNQLWRSLFNSVFVTVTGTFFATSICVLYSYALFRPDYKYRRFFTFFSFFTMLFGGGLAPTVIVCRNLLGLDDNYWALIVPLLVNPFLIIVMRSFFKTSVPMDILESATVDGSGEWRTLFHIVVPISKPGIATIALLNMLAFWNEWFIPQLYIKTDKLIPLQYLLVRMQQNAQLMAQNSGLPSVEISDMPTLSLRMALCVLIVIPIVFAYPFFQRYIVAGLTVGSVKG
jgi:putative aldouronate transport system permease protein